ncbi:MAG: ATP-grasp domain-containing protein [Microgenomates group bacterium]
MTPLENHLNSLPYIFYFLVVDPYLDISLPDLSNFISISPQKLGITLDQKNSGRLLSHPLCLDFIKKNTPSGFVPAIIPFKPSPKIDLICTQNNWVKISNPSSTNRYFEDKIIFADLLDKQGISHLPHLISTFNHQNYHQIQQKFGQHLVIQTHFGWAGNSSYLSHDFNDINSKIVDGTPIKASPFFQGISLINNCCLIDNQLIQSPPGLQFTGHPLLTDNPLATVGRQWPSHTPANINQQLFDITTNFSKILSSHKYKGFFGLDFFVSQDKVYLLECNPRLTASFAFYTQIEQKNQLDPLFYYHLLSFLPQNFYYPSFDRFNNNLVGAQLTKKNSQGATVEKFEDLVDICPTGDPHTISPEYVEKLTK